MLVFDYPSLRPIRSTIQHASHPFIYILGTQVMNNIVPGCQLQINKDQVEERIHNLQAQLADAYELRNAFAPIACLQDEILSEIFQFVCDEYAFLPYKKLSPRCHDLSCLTSISRRWRRVALSTVSLWSTIDVVAKFSKSWLRRFLTNSKGAKLTIGYASLSDLSLLRMIAPHVPRIKSLRLTFDDDTNQSYTSLWQNIGWLLPSSLEQLELQGISFSEDLFVDDYPFYPHHLLLHQCPYISWKNILPSQLTSLRLESPGNRVHFQTFCGILRGAPSLSILRVGYAVDNVPTGPVDPSHRIYLKEATLVSVKESNYQILSQILLHILIPGSANLKAKLTGSDTVSTPSEVLQFLEGTLCAPHRNIHKISQLRLHDGWISCIYNGPISVLLYFNHIPIIEALDQMDLDHLTTLDFVLEYYTQKSIRDTFAGLPRLQYIDVILDDDVPLCSASGWKELLSPEMVLPRGDAQLEAVPPFRALEALILGEFKDHGWASNLQDGPPYYENIRPTEFIDACATWVKYTRTHGYSKFDIFVHNKNICRETVRELEDVGQHVDLRRCQAVSISFLHVVAEFWKDVADKNDEDGPYARYQ